MLQAHLDQVHLDQVRRLAEAESSLFPVDRAALLAMLARLGELEPASLDSGARREYRAFATGLDSYGSLLGRVHSLAAEGAAAGLVDADRHALRSVLDRLDGLEECERQLHGREAEDWAEHGFRLPRTLRFLVPRLLRG